MKNTKTKVLILAFSSLMVLAACGNNNSARKGYYTYNTYLSTKPKTWNVHDWESSDESYIPAFCEMGLYDLAFNENRDGYVVIHEMAADFPKDVTSEALMDEEVYTRYGYDQMGNVDEGYVWEIKLNEDAIWENGDPIDATTYVESMQRQLDPKMVNFRADSYYASSLVLANAERYFKQGRSTIEALYNHINLDTGKFKEDNICEDGKFYLNIHHASPYPGSVFTGTDGSEGLYVVLNNRSKPGSNALELAAQRITDACQYYCWKYASHEGDYADDWENITGYSKLSSIKSEMMDVNIEILDFDTKEVLVRKVKDDSSEENTEVYSSDKLKSDLRTVVSGLNGPSKTWAWMLPLFGSVYNDYQEDFENVGIEAVDDYTLRLYLSKQVTTLDLEFSLTGNWIVNVPLYDKLKQVSASGYVTTKYATPGGGVKGYMSYGPYKLTSFESGKQMRMERNDKWYGYSDGEHEGQFQCTGIYTRIISDHNVAMQEFEAGRLDDIDLNRTDMKTYGNSARKTSAYESYTQKISFNSSRSKLLSRQKQDSSGRNKTILANYNFRKALSLGMDRNNFAAQATAGSKAFTGLLNDLYLTDVETGEMYRNTAQGKSVYNMVYGELGGDPYADNYEVQPLAESENGYNLAQATKFMVMSLEEELASAEEGHLTDNQTIGLEFRVYDTESETTQEMLAFIRAAFSKVIEEANKKLNKNFSITIDAVKDEDYYNSAKSGNYDLIFSTWGGAAVNPVGLMQVYCDSTFESNCEYGFKGHQNEVDLWIDLNGNGEEDNGEVKTFNNWWSEANEIAETDEHGSAAWNEKHQKILTILAGLEAGIINRFEAVPLVARASSSLNSFKIENGSKVYVNLIGYGGIRYITFNYDDYGWNKFIHSSVYSKDLYK